MTHRFATIFFLLICSGDFNISASVAPLKTSSRPVYLTLRRNPVNATLNPDDSDCTVRTRPSFFREVLNLVPGRAFEFDLLKWQQIKQSGLFSNLTARAAMTTDGAALFIEGDELPAITFSPEITLSASLEDPQVAGGVCLPF
jgi:hypothetical protein